MYSKEQMIEKIEEATRNLNAATERKAITAANVRECKWALDNIELRSWSSFKGTDKARRAAMIEDSDHGPDFIRARVSLADAEQKADNAARHAVMIRDQFTATLAIAKLVE